MPIFFFRGTREQVSPPTPPPGRASLLFGATSELIARFRSSKTAERSFVTYLFFVCLLIIEKLCRCVVLLFIPHFFFLCPGKTVICDCDLSLVTKLHLYF